MASPNFKPNTLLRISDNLAVLREIKSTVAEFIHLDPPFNSKRMYQGKAARRSSSAPMVRLARRRERCRMAAEGSFPPSNPREGRRQVWLARRAGMRREYPVRLRISDRRCV